MPAIPSGTKFIGISPNVPTPENRSSLSNSYQETYTIDDIVAEASASDTNIYNSDGTLDANRTVDLDGNSGGGVFGDGTRAGYDGTSGAGGTVENGGGAGSPGSGGGSGGDRGYAIIINSGVTLSKSGGTGTISGDEVTGTPT